MVRQRQTEQPGASAAVARWRVRTFGGILVLLLAVAGCGSDEQRRTHEAAMDDSTRHAMLPALPGSVLVDSVRADVNGDGVDELIVTSRVDDSTDDPLLLDRFDRIDVYAQGISGYRRLFVDAVDYGLHLAFEDVTGDSVTDVVVRIDAGGNNPIESQGMQIYGLGAHDALALLFHSPDGAPVLRDLDGDGRKEVLLSDQFWGMTSHSEVIGFTSEVYAFTDGLYTYANETHAAWFDNILRIRKREYEKARRGPDSEEGRLQLYRQAAEYLVWNLARGGTDGLNAAWRAERAFLAQRLGEEQFADLESFVDEITIEEHEQPDRRVS